MVLPEHAAMVRRIQPPGRQPVAPLCHVSNAPVRDGVRSETPRSKETPLKEIVCSWGSSVGVALVSDIDYPALREHTWHITEANASGKPYVRTTLNRTTVYMHRMIVACPVEFKVDHRDNDGLNNQRPNLRVSTHYQNNLNREGWSLSGYKGVSRDGSRFRTRITVGGVLKTIGRFSSAVEAAVAYDEAAHEQFGEFAWLNFPENYPTTTPDDPAEDIPF